MAKLSLAIKTDDVTRTTRDVDVDVDVDTQAGILLFGLQMTCCDKFNCAILKFIFSRPPKYIVHCKCFHLMCRLVGHQSTLYAVNASI